VLVARVEERLRINPEDGAGWSVIGPVYMRLGRYQEAAEAFRKANEEFEQRRLEEFPYLPPALYLFVADPVELSAGLDDNA